MLAARLGTPNVERDILKSLTAKQFRGWEIFESLYPMICEERMDYRIASVVQILHNIHRGEKQKALPIKDFILKFGEQEEKPKQTLKTQWNMLELLAAMHANEGPRVPTVVEFKYPTAADPEPPATPALELGLTTSEQTALDKARAAMK